MISINPNVTLRLTLGEQALTPNSAMQRTPCPLSRFAPAIRAKPQALLI